MFRFNEKRMRQYHTHCTKNNPIPSFLSSTTFYELRAEQKRRHQHKQKLDSSYSVGYGVIRMQPDRLLLTLISCAIACRLASSAIWIHPTLCKKKMNDVGGGLSFSWGQHSPNNFRCLLIQLNSWSAKSNQDLSFQYGGPRLSCLSWVAGQFHWHENPSLTHTQTWSVLLYQMLSDKWTRHMNVIGRPRVQPRQLDSSPLLCVPFKFSANNAKSWRLVIPFSKNNSNTYRDLKNCTDW